MSQNPAEKLLLALEGRRILAIEGSNFSGRTDLLTRFCRMKSDGRVYLGPEVYFALSGLTTTARQEIELHAGTSVESSSAARALEELQISHLMNHHPANLSGGEQACLTIACGIALNPAHLAIDCALEQLDHERLGRTISILQNHNSPSHCAIVTDNRLDEWPTQVAPVEMADLRMTALRPPPVPAVNPDAILQSESVHAPSIEVRNASAGYRNQSDVLHDLSIKLAPGKVYTLQGRNGSGKSTFAKLLCGVIKPDGGEILLDNKPAQPWKKPGKVVAYHLQNPDVGLFESTVAKELNAAKNPVRAKLLLDAFGLTAIAQSNPLSMPFPVRKRISLAAVIACGTPWLFLDEPTLGCDAATIANIARLSRLLAEKGHGVIIVSHSQKFLQQVGGTRLLMENGRIRNLDSSEV
jgi:energy-coupling factor transport system ATP-binding protein